jgi:hypothetical protein
LGKRDALVDANGINTLIGLTRDGQRVPVVMEWNGRQFEMRKGIDHVIDA